MRRQQTLGDSARIVVVARNCIPMHEKHRIPLTPVAVMQPNAIHLDKKPLGRMSVLCHSCNQVVHEREYEQDDRDGDQCFLPAR